MTGLRAAKNVANPRARRKLHAFELLCHAMAPQKFHYHGFSCSPSLTGCKLVSLCGPWPLKDQRLAAHTFACHMQLGWGREGFCQKVLDDRVWCLFGLSGKASPYAIWHPTSTCGYMSSLQSKLQSCPPRQSSSVLPIFACTQYSACLAHVLVHERSSFSEFRRACKGTAQAVLLPYHASTSTAQPHQLRCQRVGSSMASGPVQATSQARQRSSLLLRFAAKWLLTNASLS